VYGRSRWRRTARRARPRSRSRRARRTGRRWRNRCAPFWPSRPARDRDRGDRAGGPRGRRGHARAGVDAKRIRLWGIDGPEGAKICQRDGRPQCGDDATRALEALVDGRELTCDARLTATAMVAWLQPAPLTVWTLALRWSAQAGRSTSAGTATVLRGRAARGRSGAARVVVGMVHPTMGVAADPIVRARRACLANPERAS
jgi:hypothetical protein